MKICWIPCWTSGLKVSSAASMSVLSCPISVAPMITDPVTTVPEAGAVMVTLGASAAHIARAMLESIAMQTTKLAGYFAFGALLKEFVLYGVVIGPVLTLDLLLVLAGSAAAQDAYGDSAKQNAPAVQALANELYRLGNAADELEELRGTHNGVRDPALLN